MTIFSPSIINNAAMTDPADAVVRLPSMETESPIWSIIIYYKF